MTSNQLKRFLDPAEIQSAISEVAVLSERFRISVALIGGVAMELLGSDRLTKDVDFVCSAVLPQISIRKRLSFGGISGISGGGHPVDLVVRDDVYEGLYKEALENAIDSGLPVKVVLPEYLAAMKMAAGRDKDELDLKTLIRLDVLPEKRTIEVILKHLGPYAVREFESLRSEVAWMKSREEG